MSHHEEPEFPKLTFSIVHCTGEDEAFPVSQLVRHASTAQRGWHSMKLCEYPQEIILRFNGDVHLRMLRILAHETKIPARVDLSVCRPDAGARGGAFPPLESAAFHRLGYLNFTNNEASGFESRELKTAMLNTRAVYLKLSLRRCHANMSNVFNQVGIIAIGCYGEMVNEYAPVNDADTYAEHLPGSVRESLQLRLRGAVAHDGSALIDNSMAQQQQNAGAGGGASLGAVMDPAVVHKINELHARKSKAVKGEDFDEAKRLKIQIDRLRDCGQTLSDMEERKRRAIEAEDYDVAKALKLQIDDVRETVQAELENADRCLAAAPSKQQPHQQQVHAHQGQHQEHQQQQEATPPKKNAQQAFDDQPVGGGNKAGGGMMVMTDDRPAPPPPRAHEPAAANKKPPAKPAAKPAAAAHSFDEQPAVAQGNRQQPEPEAEPDDAAPAQPQPSRPAAAAADGDFVNPHDERPAVAGATAQPPEVVSKTGGIVVAHVSANEHAASTARAEEVHTDWEKALVAMINSETASDVPAPDPLPAKQAPATQAALIGAFGRYITSCLKSKRFQHREAAVRVLSSDAGVSVLEKRGGKAPVACVSAMLEYLAEKGQGVDDGIPQAFFAACDAIKTLLTGGITGVTGGDVAAGVAALIPQLLLKAGDSNQRVREHASATLVLLAMSSAVGPERVAAALLHDPQADSKKPLNFRVQLARLSLATVLVAKVGLSAKGKPTGLTAEGLTKQLCIPQLTHSSGEVREAAVHLIVSLYGLVQPKQMEALLADVKPAQKALIDEQLAAGNSGGAPAAGDAGAAATAASGAASSAAAAAAAAAGKMQEEELKSTSIQLHKNNPAAKAALAAARSAAEDSGVAAAAAAGAPAPAGKKAPPRLGPGAKSPQAAAVVAGKKVPLTPRGKAAAPDAAAAQAVPSAAGAFAAVMATPAAKPGAKKVAPAAKAVTKSPAPKPAAKVAAKAPPAAPAAPASPKKAPAPAPATTPQQQKASPAQQQQQQPQPEGDDEHTCQFCGRHDARYTEEVLDRHYLRSCPMLCSCPLCGQICEIALLQEHLTAECTKKGLVRACPNCHEAIRAQDLDQHIADASCLKHAPTLYNVCPLCHEKTAPFEEGWKRHFAAAPGCPNNPRPFDGGNGDEDFEE